MTGITEELLVLVRVVAACGERFDVIDLLTEREAPVAETFLAQAVVPMLDALAICNSTTTCLSKAF